jgi:hypothetical protein
MCAMGRFLRVDATHVSTEEYRMHGVGYTVRPVPGERDLNYAIAEDRSLGARLVTAKERVTWRLDLEALRAAMARDLGATFADAPLLIDGILDLGLVTLTSGRLRFVYVMGDPPAGWLDAVRRACPLGVTLVLLVPRGRAGDVPGVLAIELDLGQQLGEKRIGRVLGRAAEALGVAKEVQGWRLWDEELIVDRVKETIWIFGVAVALATQPAQLITYLAEASPRVVSTKELGAQLSSSGSDVTARKAKAETERQVRQSLEEAGVDPSVVDRLIVSVGRSGYRLGLSSRVV